MTWVKPGVAGLVHRQVDQRELELGADAGEEVEARARDLGAALDVDGPEDPAELDVVARLEALGREVARRADRLEHDVVVLAAGRGLVGGEVGDRHQGGLPGVVGLGLGGLERLDLARPAPWCGSAAPASPRPGPARSACRACFCSPRLASNSTIGRAAGRVGGERDVDDVARTARACPGPHGHGRGRHGGCAGRSRVQAIRAARRQHSSEIRPARDESRILAPVLDRPRSVQLAWAAVCFALFGLLLLAVVQDWGPLVSFDDRGDPAQQWAADAVWLRHAAPRGRGRLRHPRADGHDRGPGGGDVGEGPSPGRRLRGRRDAGGPRRPGPWSRPLVGRERPEWQLTEDLLSTKAFPSGHAAGVTAFAGILAVLVAMLVRRGNLRRAAYAGLVLLVVVVCLDRILLGRHYPTRRHRRRAAGCGPGAPRAGGVLAAAAQPRHPRRAADRGRPQRPQPGGHPQPDQGRGRRRLQGDRHRHGRGGRLAGAAVALHDGRGPGHRDGRDGLDRGRRPGAGLRRRRHGARGLRRAGRHRHPGRASSRPAPATCSPATWTSRCSSARPSTSRSPARTAPSTWSRSAATGSRTPTSW